MWCSIYFESFSRFTKNIGLVLVSLCVSDINSKSPTSVSHSRILSTTDLFASIPIRLDGVGFKVCLWPGNTGLFQAKAKCGWTWQLRDVFACYSSQVPFLSSFFWGYPEFLLSPYSLVAIWSLDIIAESGCDPLLNTLYLDFLADFSRFWTSPQYIRLHFRRNPQFFPLCCHLFLLLCCHQVFFNSHLASFRWPSYCELYLGVPWIYNFHYLV